MSSRFNWLKKIVHWLSGFLFFFSNIIFESSKLFNGCPLDILKTLHRFPSVFSSRSKWHPSWIPRISRVSRFHKFRKTKFTLEIWMPVRVHCARSRGFSFSQLDDLVDDFFTFLTHFSSRLLHPCLKIAFFGFATLFRYILLLKEKKKIVKFDFWNLNYYYTINHL